MKITRTPFGSACAVAAVAVVLLLAASHSALAAKPAPPPPPPPPPDPAFVYNTGGGGELRVMNVDGTNNTLVISGAISYHCAWSPDGQEMAFTGYGGGTLQQSGIYAIRPDGNGLRALLYESGVADVAGVGDVAWSPVPLDVGGESAEWMLFYGVTVDDITGTGEGDIFAIRTDATPSNPSSLVNLTEGFDNWHYSDPAWSPDGTRFATFAYFPYGPTMDQYLYEVRVCTLADVNGQLQISAIVSFPWPAYASNGGFGVSWARTQDKVATNIRLVGETKSRLAILDLADGSWTILSPPEIQYGDLRRPVWSPDDTKLSYLVRASSNKDAKRTGLYLLQVADPSQSTRVGSVSYDYDWLR